MKIVMLCDFFNESLEYQENLLAKYYIKHGHEVTIITSTFVSIFDYCENKYNKHVPTTISFHNQAKIIRLRYRFNILNRLKSFTNIYKILEKECPDLIFVHDITPNLLEIIKYKDQYPDCKVILDYHADYSNSAKNWLSLKILHGVVRKWFLNKARKHISKIFPIVPASAKLLNEVYDVPYSEMEILPLGADTDLGQKIRENAEGRLLRAAYGISENDIIIFSGGKLLPAKRTELLIEAILRLSNQPLHLFVIGDSSEEYQNYKRELLNLSRDKKNIHFVGWLNQIDVYRYLDMADLAVFPASQSILWQQAISMGLPLVVGNTGYQDISYLNKYRNIIILEKKDITSYKLATEIEKIVSNRKIIYEMSMGARKVANEELDWNKLILKTLRFNKN